MYLCTLGNVVMYFKNYSKLKVEFHGHKYFL